MICSLALFIEEAFPMHLNAVASMNPNGIPYSSPGLRTSGPLFTLRGRGALPGVGNDLKSFYPEGVV